MVVASLVGPALQVVKWVGAPIIRQFNYLCCFTSNINNLEQESKKLEDVEGGIQVQVDRAFEDVRIVVPQVVTWLAESKEIKDKKTAILDQVPNVGSVCLNLGARFSLSKTATKAAERMKELRDECSKFGDVSLPGPPAASEPVQMGNIYEFESRKQIEEDIMAVLSGGDVSMIGICGMGGLGKTTMAKRIMNMVLKEGVVKEAVFAVVSQPVDKLKIQHEIGGSLGLNLELENSEASRKHKLHARLNGTKRILLVLDDVWEGIELEEFGIPRDSKCCTILITSRNTGALHAMDVQKKFGMKILSEGEARFLFRLKAGTCIDAGALKSTAEDVVKECKGLPIALAIVGAALKDEKDPPIWRDALYQLRRPDHDVPDFIAKVYTPLKLSYDKLSSKQAKSLFLLCCLFPEDANIDTDTLACFGMGLGIFQDVEDLEDVRNRVSSLIKMLKGRSLLLDSQKGDDHVRIHDVVRDVCIYIAKQERYIGGNECSWISSFELFGERSNLRIGLRFPNLHLLFCSGDHNHNSEEKEFKLNNAFFEGINDLYVLCIQYYRSLKSLPPTHSLKNLKSLVLDSCDRVKTISVVGEFVNLEILICRNSRLIKELPLEIKRLNRLKLLELTGCENLQRIGQGIISSLLGLEELKMLRSFNRWESVDKEERENTRLRELEALSNLRCLEIEVRDLALAAEKMHLSSKINRFRISIGTCATLKSDDDHTYKKRLVLESKREEPYLGNSIKMRLLRDTECLHLSGNGANSGDLAKCQNIRWLELIECETMKNITTPPTVLASLEHLSLCNLPKLEGICDGPIFTNLSSINIDRCHHLCNLGQLSMAGKNCLPQLEKLFIKSCKMLEQVFLWNKEGESNDYHCITKVFPKLKEVKLHDLPNLSLFYQGTGCFEFPLLTKFSIRECPKWKSMGSNHNTGGSNADIDDDSSHLFCQPEKVSFGNLMELEYQWNPFCVHEISSSLLNRLEVLRLHKLHGNRCLFSSAVAQNLVNLQSLEISGCEEMLKVIEDKKEDDEQEKGEMTHILFPKLDELELEDLPKLVSFCEWKCDIKLPSLREVRIWGCPDMVNLSLGLLAAPNLKLCCTDLRSNLETEVSFDSLKDLEIENSEKPLYGSQFFISIFNGLKELHVFNCHGSMSCLFTSSIARRLDNLEVLSIVFCNEMVKVIEDEENEEKVGSGGQRTLLFPKLNRLELKYLPKLVSFCEWKCDIELPSMRDVIIEDCYVLRNFTMGSIAAAPNLEYVLIDNKYRFADDMNSVVQQYMEEREAPANMLLLEPRNCEKMKNMEDGEKEEEIKGGIEEEAQKLTLLNYSKWLCWPILVSSTYMAMPLVGGCTFTQFVSCDHRRLICKTLRGCISSSRRTF